MHRLRLTLTVAFVIVTGAIFVPGAAAGNFDEGAMGCSGENPATCPTGTVGQPYSLTIFLTRDAPADPPRGGDFDCARFRVSSGSFPPGLSISDEGIISGAPTQAGGYDFYLEVTYDKESACPFKNESQDRFIINVNPAAPRLIVSTASLPDANINQPYSAPLAASGAAVSSWTLAGGTLPPGVTLNPNGVISGTPTQSGVFSFTVRANGDGTSDTKQLSLFVLAPLDLGLAPNGAPAASQPLAVSMKLATAFTWITLNPDGTVTGTPTRAGVTRSTITVKDVRGTTDTLRVLFTTQALLAFHKTKVAKVGTVGKAYSWRLPVGGASETKIFLVSGRVPPGLELDEETGFLTGTPLVAGTFRVKFWALGDSGTQVSKTYRIKIQPAPRTVASRR